METFYYECESSTVVNANHEVAESFAWNEKACDPELITPNMFLMVPPDLKVNPYTGEIMPKNLVTYPAGSLSEKDLKDWILENLPNYSEVFTRRADVLKFQSELDIAKVYLFSNKAKTPPIYAALTTQFFNQVRFAFVRKDDNNEAKTYLETEYKVSSYPTMVVETRDGSLVYYDGRYKLPELVKWLSPFALSEDELHEDTQGMSKIHEMNEKKAVFSVYDDFETFDNQVLASDASFIVYFSEPS